MSDHHYHRVEDLTGAIVGGLGRSEGLTIDDLATADEFHLGGAAATTAIIDALGVGPTQRVLDIGSGLGGPARRIATVTGCHVTGVDLTPSFVTAATDLSRLVGLDRQTDFRVGDATSLDLDGSFDAATVIHVGMNLPDKPAFFASVRDLLTTGGRLVVYDIMVTGDVHSVDYPMPFASSPDRAFLASPAEYGAALTAAGFAVGDPVDRTRLALDAAAAAGANGPPLVSLATVMGPEFSTMFANLGAALGDGVLAPIEIVAVR